MKIKKSIISIIALVFLMIMTALPAAASSQPKVVDNAGLLSNNEFKSLTARLDAISQNLDFDVVVVTEKSIGNSTAEAYADDFFDYNGYGCGEKHDGALLLISMENRDWHISTTGFGIKALSDDDIYAIGDDMMYDLRLGFYYDAFVTFANDVESKVSYEKTFFHPMNLLIALAIGFVFAFIVSGVIKSQLKSVRYAAQANDYVKQGSLYIKQSKDVFLYRNIVRSAKPKNNGSGGSSTHTGSSGTSHGGGGGHF